MKTNLFISCVLYTVCFASCTNSVNRLPELETAKADSLVKFKGHEIWVTAATHIDNKKTISATLLPLHIACASYAFFKVEVFYPVTICRRPDYFVDLSEMSNLFGSNDSVAKQVNSTKKEGAFKMSGTSRMKIKSPLWCRQVYGPWIAEVTEEQNCLNSNLYHTVVKLTGVAGMLNWEWWGKFDDRFAEFGLETFGGHFGILSTRIDCDLNDLTKCQ